MPNPTTLGYGERPRLFRTTITLPFDLKEFVKTRAQMFKRAGGGANVSAYYAALTREDEARILRRTGKRGAK